MLILEKTDWNAYTCPEDPGESSYDLKEPRTSISLVEASFLKLCAMGQRVVEIGTGLGVSTRALASTANAVLSIDPDPWVYEEVVPTLLGLGVEFRPAVTDLELLTWRPTLAFIDGNHEEEAVYKDLWMVLQAIDPEDFVLLHDSKMPSVAKAAGKFPELMHITTADTKAGLSLYQYQE